MTKLEVEAFLSIVRYGSILAASEQLYISQPALSRRIQALEKELEYPLFHRSKGVRAVQLTPEGAAFLPVAQQFLSLYREAAAIPHLNERSTLRLASIGSICNFILPEVLHDFMEQHPSYNLTFHALTSAEAYRHMEQGLLDYALVSDNQYSKAVETTPAFGEPYVLVSATRRTDDAPVHPSQLDPSEEIRLPWSPEFDIWHDKWFCNAVPKIVLNEMSLLEIFLQNTAYAIVPYSVAKGLTNAYCYKLTDAPADRIIYQLQNLSVTGIPLAEFLIALDRKLRKIENVVSYLSK